MATVKKLLARVTKCGYLTGATDELGQGWNDSFWSDRLEEGWDTDELTTVQIEVPVDMVQNLIDHGTTEQYYSDGYTAWQDVLKRGRVYE